MQTGRTWKSVFAILLTLAMLAGMVSVMGAFPAAAKTTDAMKFKADFSELTAFVNNNSGTFTSGEYWSAYSEIGDTESLNGKINTWVNERFNVYNGNRPYSKRSHLGQSSASSQPDYTTQTYDADTWGKATYFTIGEDGTLRRKADPSEANKLLRRADSLAVKYDGEPAVLKNFEAELVFQKATVAKGGAVFMSFHEDTPGMMASGLTSAPDEISGSSRALAYIGFNYSTKNDGFEFVDKGTTATKTMDETFTDTLSVDGDYTLRVKVVGTKAAFWVSDANGNIVYSAEKTVAGTNQGYLSFGATHSERRFKSLTIQELDDNGNPVDFGTLSEEVRDNEGIERFTADFSDLPNAVYYNGKYYADQDYTTDEDMVLNTDAGHLLSSVGTTYTINTADTALTDYLESKFDFYYAQEGWNIQRWNVNGYMVQDLETGTPVLDYNSADADNTKSTASYHPDTGTARNSWVDGVKVGTNSGPAGANITTWALQDNKWLRITNAHDGDGTFRQQNQVAIKDANGELAELENFELDMEFYPIARSYDKAFLAVSFRSSDPAKGRGFTDRAMFAISPRGGYLLGNDFSIAHGEGYIFNNEGAGNSGINANYDVYDASSYATTPVDFTNASSSVKNLLTGGETTDNASVWPTVMTDTLSTSEPYHLYMKVVGNKATVIVTKSSDNSEVLRLEDQQINKGGAGYLTIGASNYGLMFADLEVTRLDSEGNPIDFTIDPDEGNGEYAFVADFQSLAATYRNGTYYRDNGKTWAWMESAGTSYTFDSTAADDVAAATYLSEKFNFYVSQEGQFVKQSTPYGSSQTAGISDTYSSNYSTWKATGNTWLTAVYSLTSDGGEMLRSATSIVPKLNGKEIEAQNFETTFEASFNTSTPNRGAIVLSLRSQDAGRVTTGYQVPYREKITVMLNAKGVIVLDGQNSSPKDATHYATPFSNTELYDAYTSGDETVTASTAKVYVKLVNKVLTVRVSDLATGTVYIDKTYDVAYTENGSLYYSVTNRQGSIGNIGVNVLDGNGAVIDVNDATSATVRYSGRFSASYGGFFLYNTQSSKDARLPAVLRTGKNLQGRDYFGTSDAGYSSKQILTDRHADYPLEDTYLVSDGYTLTDGVLADGDGNQIASTAEPGISSIDLVENTEDTTQNAYVITFDTAYLDNLVDELSDELYDYLDSKYEFYYTDVATYKGTARDNNWGYEPGSIYVNSWLQWRNSTAVSGDTPVDKNISVLVPKDADGAALMGSDFSWTQVVRLSDAGTYGTAYLGFNMPTAGKMGGAQVSNQVITFDPDVNVIRVNTTSCQLWNGSEWIDIAEGYVGSNTTVTLTVNVTDGVLTGSVKVGSTTYAFTETTLTNTDVGYFAYGFNIGGVNMGESSLNVTDAKKMVTAEQYEGGNIAIERVTSDVAGMYKYVATATADEGWELKANTLVATDESGNTVYPAERVGFQEDITGGNSFYFYSAEDLTFSADFYTAHTLADANMTNLGTSYHEASAGLRFVSRIHSTVDEAGVRYLDIDGEKYELADYGMIFATQAGIDWGTANGKGTELVLNPNNPYIRTVSVMKAGKYFDYCAEYVDISTRVVGLDDANALDTTIFSKAYATIKLADGSTETVYTNVFDSTYKKTSGLMDTVYVNSETGSDDNTGTEAAPVASLEKAMAKVINGGNVVISGTVTAASANLGATSGKAVTVSGGTLDVSAFDAVSLTSPLTLKDMTLVVYDGGRLYANGYAFTVESTVTVTGTLEYIFGGANGAYVETTSLSLSAGNYYNIFGGSNGADVGTTNVYVGGTVNADLRTEGEESHNVRVIGSSSGAGKTAAKTNITLAGGYTYMIYGGGQTATASETNVTVTGGEVTQVFGGNESCSLVGNTNVQLLGGTINRRMYGGCYNESASGTNHVTGTVSLTIGSGLTFTKSATSSGVSAYEGLRAGSRSGTNYEDEVATLYFDTAETQSKYSCGTSGDAMLIVNLITQAFDGEVADTTDTVTVLG